MPWWLKACPRCGGDLTDDPDGGLACVQCGFQRDGCRRCGHPVTAITAAGKSCPACGWSEVFPPRHSVDQSRALPPPIASACGPLVPCSKCGEPKPLSAYYPRSDRPSGRRRECRACKCAAKRARRVGGFPAAEAE